MTESPTTFFDDIPVALRPVFQLGPLEGYLMLLHFHRSPCLMHLEAALDRSAKPCSDLRTLLERPDWRKQLVGAVGALLRPSVELATATWNAFDGGSWISPQLGVVARQLDPEFERNARARIASRCPVFARLPRGIDAVSRHVMTGPASSVGRSAKAISALMAICRVSPGSRAWLPEHEAARDVQQMLEADVDRGGPLALEWWREATDRLAEKGHRLPFPYAASL